MCVNVNVMLVNDLMICVVCGEWVECMLVWLFR